MTTSKDLLKGCISLFSILLYTTVFSQDIGIATASLSDQSDSKPSLKKEESKSTNAEAEAVKEALITRSFIDNDGKLYWQKKLPVYLFASSSPTGSDIERLESESTSSYANPFYLDTEGVNYIRSRWATDENGNKISPEQEVMFEMYADGIAPRTSVSFDGARFQNKDGKIFYGKNLTVNALATDHMSGVKGTFIAVNSESFGFYKKNTKIENEGEYKVSIYSADNVGNKEADQVFAFTVDVTSPETNHRVSGEFLGDVLSLKAELKLESSDNLSGSKTIFYSLDDGEKMVYNNKVPLEPLTDGNHKLTYYAVDRVDNTEIEKSFDFYLDRTPPTVSAKIEGDQFDKDGDLYISHNTRVVLNSTDNKAGLNEIRYHINQQEAQVYTEPFGIEENDGGHSFRYYAIDKVNNDGHESVNAKEFSTTKRVKVDATPPSLDNSYQGLTYTPRDTTYITSETLIKLQAVDGESGLNSLTYKVNGGEQADYNNALSFKKEGLYTISYKGVDNVNNESSNDFFFVVDNSGPEVTHTMSSESIGSIKLDDHASDIGVYSKGTKVYLAATDQVIDTKDVFYRLNDGEKIKYSKPITLNEKGINTIEVTALDKLNNETDEPLKIEVFVK